MRFRFWLLAAALLPFTMNYSALAGSPTADPAGFVVAQSDGDCPEGADCPSGKKSKGKKSSREKQRSEEREAEEPAQKEEQSSEEPAEKSSRKKQRRSEEREAEEPARTEQSSEEPAEKSSRKKQRRSEERDAEEPAQTEQSSEEPAEKSSRKKQRRSEEPDVEEPLERAQRRQRELQEGKQPADEPAQREQSSEEPAEKSSRKKQQRSEERDAEEPAQKKEQSSEEPAAKEGTPESALERAQRRQRELQQGKQPTEEPAEGRKADKKRPTDEPRAEQPDREPAAAIEEVIPKDGSVMEKQLEAQGDEEEARRVRGLREKLFKQRRAADDEDGGEREARRDRDRDRDSRRDDRDRDNRRGDRDRDDRDRDRDWWDRGRGDVVERRGDRVIVNLGGITVVRPIVPDEGERLLYRARDVEVEHLRGGRTRTIVYRENGSQIVTVRDRYGDIIRRVRITRNGREIVLIDNRYDEHGPPPTILLSLPPPVIEIPEEEYIVDLGHASHEQIYGALLAPPVQPIERSYTLAEVTHNEELRAYVPRIDLDTITFEFGSATIGSSQMDALTSLGEAMEQVLSENPDEVYLIEGHTDAVGSDNDNLILSDERAEAVAVALSQNFDIPPENLVTEGYGEQYLKVDTQEPERENRRVTVRRITDLLSAEAGPQQ